MDTHRPDDLAASRSDSVSRREVLLRAGAGGLAVALLSNGIESTLAQDATPPSVQSMPLFSVPVTDMPTAPFTITMSRGTLEPGAVGGGSAPFPRIVYVEAGEKIVCPPAGEGRVLYSPDGKVLASGGGEFPFPVGTACYTSPNSLDGIRNDGTDRGSILSFALVPTTEGTPTP